MKTFSSKNLCGPKTLLIFKKIIKEFGTNNCNNARSSVTVIFINLEFLVLDSTADSMNSKLSKFEIDLLYLCSQYLLIN